MSILWTCREQCSQLFFRHFTSITSQTMANIHTRARKSPYAGTKDIHVRFCLYQNMNSNKIDY
jgi:hypothetical protein